MTIQTHSGRKSLELDVS